MEDVKGVVWVVDPIDGTLNFVHQQEGFAISIGIYRDGKPYAGLVYDVMKDVPIMRKWAKAHLRINMN